MRYKLSKEASNDLEEIWVYTLLHWSVEQADRYINLIVDEIEYLTQEPHSGKDYSYVKKDYWCSKVKSNLVFYKINNKENVLEIIRILHQQMDVDARLTD